MIIENDMFYRLPTRELSLDIVEQFTRFDYKTAPNKGPLPRSPTIWGEFQKFWRNYVRARGGIINALLFVNEDGEINYRMCFMIYSLPIVTLYVVYNIIKTAFQEHRENEQPDTAAQEENK